jgi:hypothetical protein|nr:MAG TPA: hypothetical protein [Caudoviricetes sp.]
MEYGITIYCEDSDLKTLVGSKIFEQLRGNPDYIDSRIVLNIDDESRVNIYIQYGTEIPSCLEMSNIDKIVKECKEELK